jgi:hypothetical protein
MGAVTSVDLGSVRSFEYLQMTVPQRAYPQTLRQCQGCGVFGYKKKHIATSIPQRKSVGVPLDGAAGERQDVTGLAEI